MKNNKLILKLDLIKKYFYFFKQNRPLEVNFDNVEDQQKAIQSRKIKCLFIYFYYLKNKLVTYFGQICNQKGFF